MNHRIKELRKSLGLTQAEFGKRIGVAGNTVTNYEAGLRTPKDSVLLMMSREFNVDIDWLKTGRGDMFLTVSEDAIDDFAVEFGLTDIAKEFLREFVKFSPNDQEEFLGCLKRLFPHASESEK